MKTHLLYFLIIAVLVSFTTQSVSLRSHEQLGTFAEIINNSNHVNEQVIPSSASAASTTSNKSTPKIAAAIVIPIICVGLCLIFFFFCIQCARNQQNQAERGLEETIPCYCGPVKWICGCCKYLLCIDILLRCLGFRSTNYQKEQRKRLQEEEERRRKQDKQRQKYDKKYGNAPSSPGNGPNPYETQIRRQQLSPVTKWISVSDPSDIQKITKQNCLICHKKHPDIISTCSNHCQLHLQCLISYKEQNKMSKSSNLCPGCQQNYYNMVKYFCQKCHQKCTEMQIESGNVYVSHLDPKEAIRSLGGEKCHDCAKKKWFWQ